MALSPQMLEQHHRVPCQHYWQTSKKCVDGLLVKHH